MINPFKLILKDFVSFLPAAVRALLVSVHLRPSRQKCLRYDGDVDWEECTWTGDVGSADVHGECLRLECE